MRLKFLSPLFVLILTSVVLAERPTVGTGLAPSTRPSDEAASRPSVGPASGPASSPTTGPATRLSLGEGENLEVWQSIISAADLKNRLHRENTVIVDARSAEAYEKGHIPGAISLPGESLRTPKAKPGKGDSQYIFRRPDGRPDVARYEELLGGLGISRDASVVVYGNAAGTADGSVAAMIFMWLGQKDVQFLDGVGMTEWTKAGYEVSTNISGSKPVSYSARPIENFVWNLDDVRKAEGAKDVVFYDTREHAEFTGEDKRGNLRGGHIPGAVCINYADFLDADKKAIPPEKVKQRLTDAGITPDKTVVLYCQTATRVSLPMLLLHDLGYKNLAIYDASWHEYGNRPDTAVTEGEAE